MLAGELEGREAVGRDRRFVSGVPDDPQGQLEVVRLVFHHKDLRHRASSPIRLGARRAAGPA